MGQTFENASLKGSLFCTSDLTESRFDRTWLPGTVFSHCKMWGITLRRCDIGGLTIDGVRVDTLLEAELDRLDPRRVRVRIADTHDVAEVKRGMAELVKVRGAFCERMRSVPREQLAAVAGDWHWSAIQHMRHLVFGEELSTDRWMLQSDEPYSRLGLLPDWLVGKPGYEDVGTDPTEDVEAVIAAWQRVQARTQKVLDGLTEDMLRASMEGRAFIEKDIGDVFKIALAEHDIHHIRAAEGVLAEVCKA